MADDDVYDPMDAVPDIYDGVPIDDDAEPEDAGIEHLIPSPPGPEPAEEAQ